MVKPEKKRNIFSGMSISDANGRRTDIQDQKAERR